MTDHESYHRVQNHPSEFLDLLYNVSTHKENRFKCSHFISLFECIFDLSKISELRLTSEGVSGIDNVPLEGVKDIFQTTRKIAFAQVVLFAPVPDVVHQTRDLLKCVDHNIQTFHAFLAAYAREHLLSTYQ